MEVEGIPGFFVSFHVVQVLQNTFINCSAPPFLTGVEFFQFVQSLEPE